MALSHYAVIANILQMTAHQRENGKSRGPEKWALLAEDVITGCKDINLQVSPALTISQVLPFFHVYGLIANVRAASSSDEFFVQPDCIEKIYWALFLGVRFILNCSRIVRT